MARIGFVSERMLRGFGVDLLIHSLASELSSRGHEVTVYASAVDDSYQPRPYHLERIPTRATGLFPLYEYRARHWAGFIDSGHHDLIIVHSFPFFSLLPCLQTAAVAVDAGVSPADGISLFRRANFQYLKRRQQRRYFPAARQVITISKFVQSLLPPSVQQRSSVIYCGVDHYGQATAEDRARRREQLGIQPDQRMVLYVGRLNPEGQPYKGTLHLMQAASRWRKEAPELRLVMAGHGTPEDAAEIERAGAVPLLNTPHSQMASLYAAADLYLTASSWEGFDLPVMEAASQGIPAVALNIGAHPEIIREGESGILTDSIDELIVAARRLASDRATACSMGKAAKEWAAQFSWQRAADSYEQVFDALGMSGALAAAQIVTKPHNGAAISEEMPAAALSTKRAAAVKPPNADVTAIILNYGAKAETLRKCVRSLIDQSTQPAVVLVDNNSPKNRQALDMVMSEFPGVRLLRLKKNYGFAGGMNRGVRAVTTKYVLLLNNDVTLAPTAVEEMTRAITSDDQIVGVAPKILLESYPDHFDAMGNLIDSTGTAYNMGIGQIDIGQYDRAEKTFGACFAATLLRRSAFEPGRVGELDERFFMYYEDVDWCFRAGVLGFSFVTAPKAVVYHTHSMTTRELDYSLKYQLIMRNYLWTVARNFYRGRALRTLARTSIALGRNCVRGPYRIASAKALVGAATGLPAYLADRPRVQDRRRRQDQDIFDYSHGERPYFDPQTYRPLMTLDALEAAYRRLAILTGGEKELAIANSLTALMSSRLRFDRDFVRERLRQLLQGQPDVVQKFIEDVEV